MGDKKLGVYWGNDSLYFLECAGTEPVQPFSIPFTGQNTRKQPGDTYAPDGTQMSNNIQEYCSRHRISSMPVYLGLPTKEIIFRSFIIPWMQSNEIKGVVDFESSKYIPFAIEDLVYSYHPIIITQDGVKRIRIIFVAIKKEVLTAYIATFEQAGLTMEFIEPATMSLIRGLTFHNFLPQEQTAAIITKEGMGGKIIIIDKGIPQFVREFYLKSAGGSD
ncbi:MAG: pilus assembly protein PilM, partial [Candidatus Omnitrophota bacterium]|nr:pilus assembly protein PilM [Candidatus Omnitrophota bacterium]